MRAAIDPFSYVPGAQELSSGVPCGMILIGIGMLVAGVLVGAYLIYRAGVFLADRPRPTQAAAPARPEAAPSGQFRSDARRFDRVNEAFDRVNEAFFDSLTPRHLTPRHLTPRQRTGLYQTVTVTRTSATVPPTPPVPANHGPADRRAEAPPVPAAPAPVTLFDHLAKEDESPNQ